MDQIKLRHKSFFIGERHIRFIYHWRHPFVFGLSIDEPFSWYTQDWMLPEVSTLVVTFPPFEIEYRSRAY